MRSRHWKAPQKGPWLARDTRDPVHCQRCYSPAGDGPQLQESGSSTTLSFPFPPQRSPEPQANPADQTNQHLRRFAEAKIVSPTPQIRGQFVDRGFDADALAWRVISRIRCLKRSKAFGAITPFNSGLTVKLNPRNFRSCGRAT